MTTAKCKRCGGIATGKNFDDASSKINHAVGLSRGIKCANSYGRVIEINKQEKVEKQKPSKPKNTFKD